MSITRFALLLVLASGMLLVAEEPKKPTPKFKLGKDTTFVTEPLDEEGYIDYETALNTRLRGKSTVESNAVVLLLKVFGPKPEGAELHPDFYQWLGVEAPKADGDYLKPHSRHFAQELKGDESKTFKDLENGLREKPWKPDDSPKHAEWLKLNEKPLAVAVEATRRKDYFHPMISRRPDGSGGRLIGSLLPMAQKCREVALALSLRATLKLSEGKIDEAIEDVLTIHRLARLQSRGGSLVELLVGFAIQAIAHNSEVAIFKHGVPTAKQARDYRASLESLPPMASLADKITLSERLSFLDALQSLPQGKTLDLDGVTELAGTLPAELAKIIEYERAFRLGNLWFDKIETVLRKPTRFERVAGTEELIEGLKKLKREAENFKPPVPLELEKLPAVMGEQIGKIFVGLMIPGFHRVAEAADRSDQTHRNGLLLTALAEHFADRKEYPEKLSDLVPKYISKVPDDVFSGKAMIYRKTDDGYLLYSVGPNGEDDGGKLYTDEPRGDDLGVRMPRK